VLDAIDKARDLAGQFNVREILFDPGDSARARRNSKPKESP
jgi:hypothetical protein